MTISSPVPTFFARVFGIQSFPLSRTAKAEFILPVPMGSPQNYYGVGTFVNFVAPPPTKNPFTNPAGYLASNQTSGASPSAFTAGGAWGGAGNVYTQDANNATATTNGQAEVWKTFTFGALQAGATLDGIVINFDAMAASAGTCSLKAEASWNGGGNWGNLAPTTGNLTTPGFSWLLAGSPTDMTVWGNNHAWVAADFAAASFAVRVTYIKTSGCGTVSLDELTAVVYSHTTTTHPAVDTEWPVNGPTGTPLGTQGFWGAVITKGGSRENGDQFDPANDFLKSQPNPDFDGKGVDYNIIIAGPNGQLQLYDPTFCATGLRSAYNNYYGAGDHWINNPTNPVSTTFTLYDQHGTPFDTTDDIQIATSGGLFAAKSQSDQSGLFGNPPTSGLSNCAADPYHNAWYQLAGAIPAGTYRLNVTTNTAANNGTNAENMWSAWVTSSSGSSQIYGQGKMVTYTNLGGGKQLFYLAQIAKVHAGKTMEIKLFDPGDVSGNAYLRILSPDGNAYNYASFSYTADNGRSGPSGTTQIQTASSSTGTFYQDALITIEIPLPTDYGAGGLTPPTETAFGPGWWKIEYEVNGGNDTTTWQVDIRGNPVHLVLP